MPVAADSYAQCGQSSGTFLRRITNLLGVAPRSTQLCLTFGDAAATDQAIEFGFS